MELFKLLDGKMILAQMVCFFLVMAILRFFLWDKIFKVLEERKKKIEDEMRSIEGVRAEAAALRAEMEKALANIEETAQKRLREVEHQGEARSHEMKEKARADAERIIEDARGELRFELMKTRETLKADVVDMVMKVTEEMINEKLTFENDRKLVEGLVAELDSIGKQHER